MRQPPDFGGLVIGTILVILGLTLFIHGLKVGLFPGSVSRWRMILPERKPALVVGICLCALGFGTTVAEPALIAVADEAAKVAATGGMIEKSEAAMQSHADGLG